MATDEGDDVMAFPRTGSHDDLPRPTNEARRRSWRAFQAALERHLAKRNLKRARSRS